VDDRAVHHWDARPPIEDFRNRPSRQVGKTLSILTNQAKDDRGGHRGFLWRYWAGRQDWLLHHGDNWRLPKNDECNYKWFYLSQVRLTVCKTSGKSIEELKLRTYSIFVLFLRLYRAREREPPLGHFTPATRQVSTSSANVTNDSCRWDEQRFSPNMYIWNGSIGHQDAFRLVPDRRRLPIYWMDIWSRLEDGVRQARWVHWKRDQYIWKVCLLPRRQPFKRLHNTRLPKSFAPKNRHWRSMCNSHPLLDKRCRPESLSGKSWPPLICPGSRSANQRNIWDVAWTRNFGRWRQTAVGFCFNFCVDSMSFKVKTGFSFHSLAIQKQN